MNKYNNTPLMRNSCWGTHKMVGKQNSPSGKKNKDGSPKRVNKCKKK